MDAIIYVGPMERDVEFKVIPKMETLTLVQAIEDKVEESPEEDEVTDESVDETEEESLAVLNDGGENNTTVWIIAGAVIVVGIGALIVLKVKKKW